MPYEPFLIANLKTGLELGLQPWLLPGDAFAELTNAYLNLGVLYKRKGYSAFGRLSHIDNSEFEYTDTPAVEGIRILKSPGGTEILKSAGGPFWLKNPDVINILTGTLAGIPIKPDTVTIELPTETITDDGNGILTGNHGATGTINYTTGAFSITPGVYTQTTSMNNYAALGFPGVGGFEVHINKSWWPDQPCMGIFNYTSAAGAQALLAFDTKRAHKYNESSNEFEDIALTDIFTSYDHEYTWMVNWLNRAFICNGRDQTRMYDGTNLTALNIDLDGDLDNDLDSVYLVFPYKDRLVFLRTSEFGNLYPQRARWTKVGKYDESEPLAFNDAPTDQWIVGAAFIRNELCVFFERSVWLLRYTGDSRLPFRWVRVAANEGLMAKMGMMDFSDEILGIGPTRLIGTDGDTVYSVDDRIPNLILSMNQDGLQYCYASALDEVNQFWMSYPEAGQTLPNKVLSLNYEEKAFSIFNLAHMVTGYYQENFDLTWDEVEETWDELEISWDDRAMQAGYPLTLGGDHQGYVWKLNSGGSDNGSAIEMAVKTGRMNPYIKEGRQARLGWVDILVDRDPLINLDVQYFINHEENAWFTDTLNLDDGSANKKIWVRSYVGNEADFHQMRFYNNATNQTVVIHGLLLYFERAGVMQ